MAARQTVVAAPTGIAACQLGGITLHAFAGIRRGDAPMTECLRLASRPAVARRWRQCKTLVIDEVCRAPAHPRAPLTLDSRVPACLIDQTPAGSRIHSPTRLTVLSLPLSSLFCRRS